MMQISFAVERRIEELVIQVRWLKRGLIAALGLPALALLLGQASPPHSPAEVQDVVKAKQFSLVDDEGDCRAILGFAPGVMVHGQSQPGFEQVILTLSAKRTAHAAQLRVMHDGTPAIGLLGADGKSRIAMRLQKDDSPNAWFMDDKGVDRVKIAIEPNGEPSIVLKDASGKETTFKP